jgi:hypothetical protein
MTNRIVLFTLLAAAAGLAQTVNCVVAVVNGEIITLLDVEVTAEFGLGRVPAVEEGTEPRLAALDTLIDRKIVLDLAREARGVGRNELAAAVDDLRRALGEEAFSAKLGKFGLRPGDLEPYLVDRILCERALTLRFSQSIPVSVTEIERHYRDIYAPERARLGLEAEPLEHAADAIEAGIRDERRARQTADWVRGLRDRAEIQIRKDCLK